MNEQRNTHIVQQSYAAFGRGDIEAVLKLYAKEIHGEVPGPSALPITGKYTGRDGLKQFLGTMADVQEPLHFEPQEFVAQGDKVVVLGNYRWRVKATGLTYSAQFAHVLTLRDEKITGFMEYTDTAAMAAAMLVT